MVWYGMVWFGFVWYGLVWYESRPLNARIVKIVYQARIH